MESAHERLDAAVRGACAALLQLVLEIEADLHVERHAAARDARGRLLVVRNGHHPARAVAFAGGQVELRAPRVRRRGGGGDELRSVVLPRYVRSASPLPWVDPALVLQAIETRDPLRLASEVVRPRARPLLVEAERRLREGWAAHVDALGAPPAAEERATHAALTVTPRWTQLAAQRALVTTRAGRSEIAATRTATADAERDWLDLLLALEARGGELRPEVVDAGAEAAFWRAAHRAALRRLRARELRPSA